MERCLTAILAADVVGYSRLMGDPDDTNVHYNAACAYAQLGDIDASLDLLERCLPNLGAQALNWARHDSDLEPLRKHSRFQQLLERLSQNKC